MKHRNSNKFLKRFRREQAIKEETPQALEGQLQDIISHCQNLEYIGIAVVLLLIGIFARLILIGG